MTEIEFIKKGNTKCEFRNLKHGDYFIDDDNVLLKIVTTAKGNNAVFLNTGSLYKFEDDVVITRTKDMKFVYIT